MHDPTWLETSTSSEKEQLIMVAAALFSRHGFHPFDVDQILAEAGVAHVTLYNHSLGTDDLISAVLDRRYQGQGWSCPHIANRSWPTRSLCDAPVMVVTRQGMRLG
jgi:AcrR family transcriptional regulator